MYKQCPATWGVFYLRRLTGNVAGELGNAYLRYHTRQPATCFPLTEALVMLSIPVLPFKWKAPLDNKNFIVQTSTNLHNILFKNALSHRWSVWTDINKAILFVLSNLNLKLELAFMFNALESHKSREKKHHLLWIYSLE